MSVRPTTRIADAIDLWRLSAHSLAGRRPWLVAVAPLLWPAVLAFLLAVGWRQEPIGPSGAQGVLIGFPLTVAAILLGVRVIAGEIDRRTLEIAYTVPGGAARVWTSKLLAALALLLAAEATLAVAAWTFFTRFPASALYGALQAASFYLVLAATLGAFFRSETSAAFGAAAVLVINGVLTGFGEQQLRVSPFFNPLAGRLERFDPSDVLAWTIQNRVGVLLAVATLVALGFARAERRERLLGG